MQILLSHGAGGEMMNRLIENSILKNLTIKSLGKVGLSDLDDGASISIGEKEIVLSTDSYIVKPIFFPGGDIGKLAACGTINDISMMGAHPLALTLAIIVEEGFDTLELEKIIRSLDEVCTETGVSVITGDTKVMEKGKLDKIIINTTGIGIAENGYIIKDSNLSPGDRIILSGTIGDHGVSLMSFREGFGFETTLCSDVAPLWHMVRKALAAGRITAMRDPTRGGLAATLNDWARKSNTGIIVQEEKIPVRPEVAAASRMLGIDPYIVANEGKAVIGVCPEKAERVLAALRNTEEGKNAQIIGEVISNYSGKVILETIVGGRRLMEPPVGDPVPRVC
ncbi:MAG: hydrogenase expression/formation protein HypE [Candidatus Methanoperedens sp.]|nr:hydrogenase expression/formation protein HypE [Candidatus Methanoperedens sp.]MCE8424845.1 hydrogenase expression/formation protein HypE [Candidatus Methanoperedens sp.]MCE8427900.1 hydrogenase expression/formation protein HypE [Candidatus Methanoperedens sp.]